MADTERGIKPAIGRLAKKAGIKSEKEGVYKNVKHVLKDFLKNVLHDAVIVMGSGATEKKAGRKILKTKDIAFGLERRYKKLYGGAEEKVKKCAVYKSKTGKKRKAKAGEVALRKIRFYQKQRDCVTISRAAFARLVRAYLKEKVKISSGALSALQYAAEAYIIEVLHNAHLVALHCKRTRLSSKDINLARKIAQGL